MNGKTIGVILAGGIGSRFRGDKPKQYYLLNGREMISYAINAYKASKLLDDFVVVLDEAEYAAGRIAKEYGVHTVLGGKTRNHSLRNAMEYIYEHYADCKTIIDNNAACPLITAKVVDDLVKLANDYDYVQCAYKITDALGSYAQRDVNREDYFLIQTPIAYNFPMLYACFNPDIPNGHPVTQLPKDAKGYNYFDFQPNYKVTYPEDLRIVETIMANNKGK